MPVETPIAAPDVSAPNLPSRNGSMKSVLPRIALAGNPNAGKTTLFNALTGMRQKVGNYPGVTVEKKEGRCVLTHGREVAILDLPGTYSLSPKSPDEEVARDVLLGLRADTPVPDAVVIVVDASNLERNLYFATQVLDLGIPAVIALNMGDVAAAAGKSVDAHQLSQELGAPVVPLIANKGEGVPLLKATLLQKLAAPHPPGLELDEQLQTARERLAQALVPRAGSTPGLTPAAAEGIALRLLAGDIQARTVAETYGPDAAGTLAELRADKQLSPLAAGASETAARYKMLGQVVARAQAQSAPERTTSFTDRADAILTHKVWGLAIFALITLLVFQAIFSWANLPMDLIDGVISSLGELARRVLPDGPFEDLMVEGVIAGVGAVVIFLPQILILFFFIGLLEDTGYMARAAFIMDRLMGKVGLHGRSFIPLMSSFACAIPGIMATRTISSNRDRMTTILIAPLMACSARLPVYILMIATFIPARALWGVTIGGRFFGITLPVAVMFSLYALGVLVAMAAAWVFKKTLFAGPTPALMLELPPYKMPAWRNILVTMWDRGSQFLKRAGTVILSISIVLWFMLSYPKINPDTVPTAPTVSPAAGIQPGAGSAPDVLEQPAGAAVATREEQLAAAQLRGSFAGRVGHIVEPLIKPLGFNWKIGVGLIGAMAAREVFVSTMGTVYAVGDADETSVSLKDRMKDDRWPDGRPVWTTATAISLLVYFVIAMQCISTLAVVKRETNGWRWPLFMQVYLTGLAWLFAFGAFHIARAMGW
jgi:ferrous iron transport protein B